MFKPLLAATLEDPSLLKFPLMASPKLDGIRAIVRDGKLVSRTMKPIPNTHVREMFSRSELEGFDGELIVGDPTDPECFNRSTSAVMSSGGMPEVAFWVFDRIPKEPALYGFVDRYHALGAYMATPPLIHDPRIEIVEHIVLESFQQMTDYEQKQVDLGFEGIMLRDPNGPYKFGRSTVKEQTLMKVKRFEDDEAVILDVIEGQHNGNAAEKDAFGRTKRSSAKAGQVPNGLLGALRVRNTKGQVFNIGTGYDAKDHKELWERRAEIVGKTIKYRYQKAGMKDLPRFPSYFGFRED